MISDITLGQYLPGDSILHKMDGRMKIVLTIVFMISIFLCQNYISLGITVLIAVSFVLISKIRIKVFLKGLKPILVIVIFTTILNLLYGSGEALIQFWFIKITENGIHNSVFMALRIIILVIFGLLLTYTTTPTNITNGLESLLKPLTIFNIDVHSFAMTMTIALRFIPTLLEEVEKIMQAQKSRGADMDSGGIIARVKAVIPIMIPLFISSFRRANELEYAMECRCYRGGRGRTKMNVMHLKAMDYIALAATVIYFVGMILLRIFTVDII